MKLSIVVPAFNEEKCLPATLAKIGEALAAANSDSEIIVVDNDSADATARIARDAGATVVSEKERNIGRARNAGARAATSDVVVFIDADTLVPRMLFQIIGGAMKNENCFGGAVAVGYEEFERKWMRFYLLGWQFWGALFNMKQGAAQFCRKTAFSEIGGYDETIFMGEDVEFYWRLSKFAKRKHGRLCFIESPKVVTSARRFDKMSVWKTLLLTHPLFIALAWKKKSFWKDWYEKAIR